VQLRHRQTSLCFSKAVAPRTEPRATQYPSRVCGAELEECEGAAQLPPHLPEHELQSQVSKSDVKSARGYEHHFKMYDSALRVEEWRDLVAMTAWATVTAVTAAGSTCCSLTRGVHQWSHVEKRSEAGDTTEKAGRAAYIPSSESAPYTMNISSGPSVS
jgi:hypothetical protein